MSKIVQRNINFNIYTKKSVELRDLLNSLELMTKWALTSAICFVTAGYNYNKKPEIFKISLSFCLFSLSLFTYSTTKLICQTAYFIYERTCKKDTFEMATNPNNPFFEYIVIEYSEEIFRSNRSSNNNSLQLQITFR